MAASRFCTVAIKVGGANAAIDVTSDLINFSIEDTIQSKKADCLSLQLDDASKRYRNTWYIEKGTQIEATVTTHNWNTPGDSQSRDFGAMWVDTVDMNLKPSQITIKATGVPPALEKGGQRHSGTEGQPVTQQVAKETAATGTPSSDEGYSDSASAKTQTGNQGFDTIKHAVASDQVGANIQAGGETKP